MLSLISKIHSVAEKLEDIYERDDLADRLDKIATEISAKYVFRIKKPRKSKGISKTKRRLYYKMHRQRMRTRMKMYRKIHKFNLKKRKHLLHYHRFG
jgi:hypothetical protein